ncbi:MAG: stage III sporulation protein AF [Thermoanaerobacterales bacterium]|nr:stage III sporulation protein AF [Thermoanaerobacterales bacterium]
MENISIWIRQVILVVIFTVFINFFMPNNQFLKYANVLLSLLIMIAMLTPIFTFFNLDPSTIEQEWVYQDLIDNKAIAAQTNKLNEKNNELIIRQYKENVKSYMCQQISTISDFDVKTIQLTIEENSKKENFGEIKDLYIVLKNKDVYKTKSTIIPDVQIEVNNINEKDDNPVSKRHNKSLNEIKQSIMLRFGLLEKNMRIELEE